MNLTKQKILIVDDSSENLQLLFAMLQEYYEVLFATTGSKAIQLAVEQQPDIVLLDIVMPQMDGYEVIRQLKKNKLTQSIPVVFLTAKTAKEDLIKAFRLGSVDYITKPFFEEEIKVRLATHLQNRLLLKQLEEANAKLEKISLSDPLTGVANRRYFDLFFAKQFSIFKRDKNPLSLLMIDVDYFKKYNDSYGHQAGDVCLQSVAHELDTMSKRDSDLVARYGGEEFVVVLSNTKIDDASQFASDLCYAIENLKISHAGSTVSEYVTISIGLCCFTGNGDGDMEDLIKNADKALYTAKSEGRNRVVIA